MNRTYAPNAIVIGFLAGMIIAAKYNTVLGVLAGAAVCIIGWVLIRAFEKAVDHAGDMASDAVAKKIQEYKNNKNMDL